MSLKIGILGTRGIPNQYGGFEQVAENLSVGLMEKGYEVMVYNSHKHPYQEKQWNGVPIIHCYDPEFRLGTAGQFIYDFNCIRDARKRNFDILLMLGYTSSSVWKFLYPKKTIIISNMDGLEWSRAKYSAPVKRFLRYAERLAVSGSDYHIADSVVIKDYLDKKYHIQSTFIAYGARIPEIISDEGLARYGLQEKKYFLLMARMEPENNIEMLLDGFHQSKSTKKFVVIGNTGNKFGQYLLTKYKDDPRILFLGAIFDQHKLAGIIHFSAVYFHGHSVGGTNPSLLEAMAAGAFIAAHANAFNKSILKANALYFGNPAEVTAIIEAYPAQMNQRFIDNNYATINTEYTWQRIISQYDHYFKKCYQAQKGNAFLPSPKLAKQMIEAD